MPVQLNGSTSGSVQVDVPATVSGGDVSLTLPNGIGSANQFLKNSGTAGTLEFAALAGSNMPTGSILQVVQTTKTNQFATSSNSYVDVTGMSASITPSATSSKILVRVCVMIGSGTTSSDNKIRVLRGSSNILTTDYVVRNDEGTSCNDEFTIEVLDSPSTTSETTYKLQGLAEANELFVNRRGSATVTMGQSTITLMEVAA